MAWSAPRHCPAGHPPYRGARCPVCTAASHAATEARRPGARRRGYDTEFQRAAAEYLKTHPACTCGRPAVLVRHKVSIRRRPDLRMDPANWQPGCRSCNAADMHREKREGGG